MKAVILRGGRGNEAGTTRGAAIGGRPVVWHVMHGLARFGVNDFIVCGDPIEPVDSRWRIVGLADPSLKRAEPYIDDDLFVVADGRGLADIDLDAIVGYARQHGGLATVTAVRLRDEFVSAGLFVLRRGVFDYLTDDDQLEHEPLVALARDSELFAFRHEGFWHPVASDVDCVRLNELWASGRAPWAA